VLLKLYIYGYLNRVQSSRRLEREALRNVDTTAASIEYIRAGKLRALAVTTATVLDRPLHRQIGWSRALENAIDIRSRAPEDVDLVSAKRHQAAFRDERTIAVDRGHAVLLCQPYDRTAM
jgi:hypothetical protein